MNNTIFSDLTNFIYVPEKYITEELCTYAINMDTNMLQYVPEKFKTEKLCMIVLSMKGIVTKYYHNLTNEIYKRLN